MGATAHIKSIPPQVLELLLARPHLVESFVCCYPFTLPPGTPERLRKALSEDSTLAEMHLEEQDELREQAPDVAETLIAEAARPHLNLDKAWDALSNSILRARADGIAARCIFGGHEIGPNLGYACGRYLTAEEVPQTSSALAALPTPKFEHPVLGVLFEALKEHYAAATAQGHAMLQTLA